MSAVTSMNRARLRRTPGFRFGAGLRLAGSISTPPMVVSWARITCRWALVAISRMFPPTEVRGVDWRRKISKSRSGSSRFPGSLPIGSTRNPFLSRVFQWIQPHPECAVLENWLPATIKDCFIASSNSSSNNRLALRPPLENNDLRLLSPCKTNRFQTSFSIRPYQRIVC